MHSISFPPPVLERIVPDLSLERHIRSGVRSNYRRLHEFSPITVLNAKSNGDGTTLYVQQGRTLVITTITYSVSEIVHQSPQQYTSIYPNVTVARGRSTTSAPTDEEINLCQSLYEAIMASRLISNRLLEFTPFLKVADAFVDPRDVEIDSANTHKFNLLVNFKVLGRSGPLFDVLYYSATTALRGVQLPMIYIDESRDKTQLLMNLQHTTPLDCKPHNISSNFGLYPQDDDIVVVYDLENETEEAHITTKVSVIADAQSISSFTLVNGGLLEVTKKELKAIIAAAQQRSI